MNQKLSIDENNALEHISKLQRGERPNACISRNSKHLIGIKLIAHRKDGSFELTELGKQTLFTKQCIDGLKEISVEPNTKLSDTVSFFLHKKGFITQDDESKSFSITNKGLECLTDIQLQNTGN